MSHALRFRCPAGGPSRPATRQAKPAGNKVRTVLLCAAVCLVEAAGFAGLFYKLAAGRQARRVELANLAVAQEVDAARGLLESRDWDGALARLETAVATDDATDLGEAETLLGRARQGKAAALAEAERRREEERRRQEEALHQERLRREEARRQEREDRVCATPLFRELRDRVAQTRAWLNGQGTGDPALFALLFRELKVTDAREQDRLRRAAGLPPEEWKVLEQRLARIAAGIKERFRLLKQFGGEEQLVFERLVDQEVTQCLDELKDQLARLPDESANLP